MSYEFTTPRRFAVEVRRVATERLECALEQLTSDLVEDPATAVHSARKDIKKTRSLLRLIRFSLGEDLYRAQNDRLRDAAHTLAGAREADAKVESLDALIVARGDTLSPAAAEAAHFLLDSFRSHASSKAGVESSAGAAVEIIAAARGDARLWPLGHESFGLISRGLGRTYRQGRKTLGRAMADPTDDNIHEWRKRVKDMWYSLRLLNHIWPDVLGPLATEAHSVSELLGDHHDLGEVRNSISALATVAPGARRELDALAAARQDELWADAAALGRRLYSAPPRRYVGWLEGLWRSWEMDEALQDAHAGLPGS